MLLLGTLQAQVQKPDKLYNHQALTVYLTDTAITLQQLKEDTAKTITIPSPTIMTLHNNNIARTKNAALPDILNGTDRLCGLVVSTADYKHRGPGFDSRALLGFF
jgi:hypothetical protein